MKFITEFFIHLLCIGSNSGGGYQPINQSKTPKPQPAPPTKK